MAEGFVAAKNTATGPECPVATSAASRDDASPRADVSPRPDATGRDLAELLLELSDGVGFDVVIEASGAAHAPSADSTPARHSIHESSRRVPIDRS